MQLCILPYIRTHVCGDSSSITYSQATHLQATWVTSMRNFLSMPSVNDALGRTDRFEDVVSDTCSQRTAPLGYLSLGLFGGFWPCLCTRLVGDKPVGVHAWLLTQRNVSQLLIQLAANCSRKEDTRMCKQMFTYAPTPGLPHHSTACTWLCLWRGLDHANHYLC